MDGKKHLFTRDIAWPRAADTANVYSENHHFAIDSEHF